MLNRCRERNKSAGAIGLTQCGRHRAHLVVAHNAFIATQGITDFISGTELDPSSCFRTWQRRPIHDENVLTEIGR